MYLLPIIAFSPDASSYCWAPKRKKEKNSSNKRNIFLPFFLQAARYIIWMIGFCKASKRDPYFSTSHFGAVNKSWDQVSLFFLAAESL